MVEKKLKRLSSKGERVYRRLLRHLIPKYKGRIIAIEPDSGKYFIGRDELKVALKAMKAFPNRLFRVFRIGYPAVHKFKRSHETQLLS